MSDVATYVDDRGALARLRDGECIEDGEFDQSFSPEFRRLSAMHWTPVAIARRAAQLLVAGPNTRVLDVGCGPGKFCIVGALTTAGTFTGVEQRRHFINEADRLVRAFEVPRINLVLGNMIDLDWSAFDAFYLYNPFLENMATHAFIDDTIKGSFELFDSYVDAVRRKLDSLPIGTRAATFHGFGGRLPSSYDLETSERVGRDKLNVWVRVRGEESCRSAEATR